MSAGNLIKYTAVFSYLCVCGVSNSGSLKILAATEYAAVQSLRTTPLTCSACGRKATRENLQAHIQMLSF
jgi:hypothetical protein